MKVWHVWSKSYEYDTQLVALIGTYATMKAARCALVWLKDHQRRAPRYKRRLDDYAKRVTLWRREAGARVPDPLGCDYIIASAEVLEESQFPTIKGVAP